MRVGLLPGLCLHRGSSFKSGNISLRSPLPEYTRPLTRRHITYTNCLRYDDGPRKQQTQAQVQLRTEDSESIKPESYQERKKAGPGDPPKTDALLSEQTVSNKEQRKADWAIMKEMARYLWPKVECMGTPGIMERSKNLLGRSRCKSQSRDCPRLVSWVKGKNLCSLAMIIHK